MTFLKVLLTPEPSEDQKIYLHEEFKVVTLIVIMGFRFVMDLFPFLMEQNSCRALTNSGETNIFLGHIKNVFVFLTAGIWEFRAFQTNIPLFLFFQRFSVGNGNFKYLWTYEICFYSSKNPGRGGDSNLPPTLPVTSGPALHLTPLCTPP